MNDTHLQYHDDEITDSTSTSAIAVFGFLISMAGIFSLAYVQMLPFAIIASLMGAFVLITATRFRLNWLSRILGFLALVIGSTTASWGLFERSISTNYDVTEAKRIAELYLSSLSSDELEKVYYLVGFQFEGESPEQMEAQATDIQKGKRRLAEDPAHLEIRSRKTPSKWVFVSLDGETQGTSGYSYRLRYRDEGQTIPPSYWVYARKDSGKFEIKDKVRWFVDNLERVKTP